MFFETEITSFKEALIRQIGEKRFSAQKYDEAIRLLRNLTEEDIMPSFLTTKAYELI